MNPISVTKIITILAFCSIILALYVIAITQNAICYEISIYDAYPYYFWLFLLVALACGIIILVYHAFSKEQSHWWKTGFSVIIYTNVVILLLPIFRGYTTFARTRGDELTHIGYIKDILCTGHFISAGNAGANPYPTIHIIGANITFITELMPELLTELLPFFFTLFYIFSIYLLSRKIAKAHGQALLITAFGSLLLFTHENLMLSPSVVCFYMLPSTLFLLYKSRISANRDSHSLLFILILLSTPFLHPGEGSLFLILIFVCIWFSLWFYSRIKKPLEGVVSGHYALQNYGLIIPNVILFVAWFSWFSIYSTFGVAIREVVNWLVYQMGSTTSAEYAEILAKANLTSLDIVELLLKMWGQAIIYCLVAAVICVLVWKRFLSPKGRTEVWQFSFSCLFTVFSILLFAAYFTRAIFVDYNREMRYLIFAATILNGLGLYSMFQDQHKKIGMFTIALLLVASATVSVFNTFPSPIVVEANSQVTQMEMTGMEHFFQYRNISLLIDDRDVPQTRFWDALFGVSTRPSSIRYYPSDSPADHFGYLNNSLYGESFSEDRYFVENKLSRIIYPGLAPDIRHLWKFTPEDFIRLDNEDVSVSKLYSNGEFWFFLVKSASTALEKD